MDSGAWWATVHTVTKSRTRLKQLSMAQHTHTHTHTHMFVSISMLHVIFAICKKEFQKFTVAQTRDQLDGNRLCLSCVQLTCLAHLDSVHRNAAASWLKNARAGTTAVPTVTTFF